MSDTLIVGRGYPIQEYYKVDSTVATTWTDISVAGTTRPFVLRGAYLSASTTGSTIKLRDSGSTAQICIVSSSTSPAINYLSQSITLIPPVQYYDSTGSTKVVLFGEFI
jgi:hypothetical protein